MANASQLFKDDEQDRAGNGYTPDHELRKASNGGNNTTSDSGNSASSNLLGSDELASAEAEPFNSNDSLYNPDGAGSLKSKVGNFLVKNRKKSLIGGGIVGAIIGLIIAAFMALIPLKIEHVVQNLQKHFFATSENALQNETEHLYEDYMIRHVLPSYKSCYTVVTSKCSVSSIAGGKNPVTNLYKTWANAKLETKLATDYGIEFSYDRTGKTWMLKAPGTSAAGDALGDSPSVSKLDAEFKSSSRATMRAAIKDAVQSETKSTQIFYRYKVGRLLEEKYGIKRCIIFCGTKDKLAGKVESQKTAAKLFLVERVIMPRNQTLGIALMCLLSPCGDTTSTSPSDAPAENGAPENKATDTAVRKALTESAAQFGVDAEKLISTYNDIAAKGFQKYLVEKGLTSIGINSVVAGTAADQIPVIGYINMASVIVNTANDASSVVKKFAYAMNAAAAVNLYMMYRTYADEIHTGNVSANEVGSFVSSLGSGNSGANTDPIVGGTASAEGTPLYSSLINGSSSPSGSTNYICNNGQPVPAGQMVCPEEYLGQGNSKLNAVHSVVSSKEFAPILDFFILWKNSIGQVFNWGSDLLGGALQGIMAVADLQCKIAGSEYVNPYCIAKNATSKYAPKVINFATQWLFPNPFSSNMSGGRTFDMMAAGADVAGNDSAHTTLGGQALTAQQVADITNQQEQSAQQSFSHQSFFARMFSTSSQYSLVSRLAMAMPFNFQSSAQASFASLISNPFVGLFHSFSTILSGGASAAVTAQPDPFGITQYGYPVGSISSDPEAYWNANCSDNAAHAYQNDANWNDPNKNWNNEAVANTDQATGMPVNTSTNECLLIKSTVGVAGGLYETSLLTNDDLATSGVN